jgi:CPA2 family monovalent cation:H+ antiporter-2
MPHDVTLIATLAVGFVFAFVLGYFAHRLRLPPLVGYLLAGVLIGGFRRESWRTARSPGNSRRSA